MRFYVVLTLMIFVTSCAPNAKQSRAGQPSLPENKDSNQTRASLSEGLGFHSIDAEGVPETIAAAADAVFALRTLGANDPSVSIRHFDVSNDKGRAEKEKILALQPHVADEMDKVALIKQIENCERSPNVDNQKDCVVSYSISKATGFIAGADQTLWTNAHVVEPSLGYIQALKGTTPEVQLKKRGRVAVFVFSRDGRLLVNPFVDPVRLKIVPELTNLASAAQSFYGDDSDYVGLSLTRSIGTPLGIATLQGEAERIFTLGFPTCTGCDNPNAGEADKIDYADRAPRSNSDGAGLKITVGATVAIQRLQRFFGVNAQTIAQLDNPRVLFTTADSQHGNSGGPVLNELGQVVAIHAGGKSKMIEGRLARISRAVIMPELGN